MNGRWTSCFLYPGDPGWRSNPVWNVAGLMGEGEDMVGLCDGSYVFCSEAACVTSTHISLAKSDPTAKLDVDGAGCIIFPQNRSDREM